MQNIEDALLSRISAGQSLLVLITLELRGKFWSNSVYLCILTLSRQWWGPGTNPFNISHGSKAETSSIAVIGQWFCLIGWYCWRKNTFFSLWQMQEWIFFRLVCSLLPDAFILGFYSEPKSKSDCNRNWNWFFPKIWQPLKLHNL